MRYLLLALLFLQPSCEDGKQKSLQEIQIAKQDKAEKESLINELKAKNKALEQARLEAKVAQEKLILQEKQVKETFLKEEEKKAKEAVKTKENEKLSKLGINIKKNTITIDTNKTKSFFEDIAKRLGKRLENLTKEIEDGVNNKKEAGIDIDASHINIDLNKTNKFVNKLGEKMQGFIKEFDTMAKELDIDTNTLKK